MNSIKTKKAKYSSKNLLFALALIISCVGCEGQISSKKSVELHSNKAMKTELVDLDSLADNPIQKDSSVYNQYKNGEKDGLWKEFDENNQLITEGYYVNGKANGLMKWYWGGNLVASGNMKDDKRHGLWKICDYQIPSNCIEASFNEDKKVGTWRILHDNGKLAKEQYWNDGKMVTEKCWDENGIEIKCK
jgi:hypothetical protein